MTLQTTPIVENQTPPILEGNNNTSNPTISADVNIKEKTKDVPLKMNMMSNLNLQNFMSKPTEAEKMQNTSQQANPLLQTEKPKLTVVQSLDNLKKEEQMMAEQFTVEDFEDLADFIIEIIDWGMIFILRAVAMDNSDAPYKVPEDKLKKMKRLLTKILMKMQMKFPLGFLLFVAFCMAYATPMRKAWGNRKGVLGARAKAIGLPENSTLKEIKEKEKELKEPKTKQQKQEKIKTETLKESVNTNLKKGNTETVQYEEIKVAPPVQQIVQTHQQQQTTKLQQTAENNPVPQSIEINPLASVNQGGAIINNPQRVKVEIPFNPTPPVETNTGTAKKRIPNRTGNKRGGHNK